MGFQGAKPLGEFSQYRSVYGRNKVMPNRDAIHPGFLIEQRWIGTGWSESQFAKKMGFAQNTLRRCMNGKRPVSDGIARKLEENGLGSAESWLLAQARYDYDMHVQKTTSDHNKLIEENKALTEEKTKLSTSIKRLTAEKKSSTVANKELIKTSKDLLMKDPDLVKAIEGISKALGNKDSVNMSGLKKLLAGNTALQVILGIILSG